MEPHNSVYQRYVPDSYWEEESDVEFTDACLIESDWDEYDYYFEDDEADTDAWSDTEEDDDPEVDDDSSEEDEGSSDAVEYVHFGKLMEHDGSQWAWEKDVDLWWVMCR